MTEKPQSILKLLGAFDRQQLAQLKTIGDPYIAHEWMVYKIAANHLTDWFLCGNTLEIEPSVFHWLVESRASKMMLDKPMERMTLAEVERARGAVAAETAAIERQPALAGPMANTVPF